MKRMADDMIDDVGFILAGLVIPPGVQVVRDPPPLRGISLVYQEKMMVVDLATSERPDVPGTHSCRWYTRVSGVPVFDREMETTHLSALFDAVADFLAAARRQAE